MKPLNLIICLLLIMTGMHTQAQSTLRLLGTVTDSVTHKPADYITVNLKANNVYVKALVTKETGAFTFTGLKPLKYTLTFSAMGYQTKTILADLSGDVKKDSLGVILVSPVTKQLKEVAITADKPLIKQEVDRISYDLQADPDSKVSNVLEMLRKVPFVTVDGDENVLLKGQTDYKVFINGKPSAMMDHNLKAVLRSIPASTIQRIEVITTPPARYDAEGLAGIINIITNKKVDNGYNGTFNISERFPATGPTAGTSFTIKDGKFGLSAFGSANTISSPATNNSATRITTGTDPTSLIQQGTFMPYSRNGNFGTELSYEIDSLHLVSGQFSLNGYRSHSPVTRASLLTDPTGIVQAYDLDGANRNTGKGYDGSVNYQLGFKNSKTKLLTFSYRYSDYVSTTDNQVQTTNRINYTTPDNNQNNDFGNIEQTAQVDYVQGLKKWNIEAGVKGIFRKQHSNFLYSSLNPADNLFEPDTALSNKYNSTQDIFAAYNSWQYAGKNWGLKGGLRVEQTITNGNFVSTATTVHQSYLNVIPSIAFNWNFTKLTGINFGFTQRVKRPGIYELNPFTDRSNPDFQTSGNPDLHRVLINDMQLGYHINKKGNVNIGLVYDFARNLDLRVSTFDTANNVTYTTYKNVGKVSALGSNIFINYPITKKWNFSLNANIMRFWLNGDVDGVLQENNFWTVNISSSTGYSFEKGWRVSANFDLSGRNPTGLQGSSTGVTSTAFNVSKQVIKNKLTLSASLRNPFTKYIYGQTDTFGPDFRQTTINQNYFRSVNFSLNYNFGKLKDGIKKTKRGINNDDK
jgi:ferric enterobactin receptor